MPRRCCVFLLTPHAAPPAPGLPGRRAGPLHNHAPQGPFPSVPLGVSVTTDTPPRLGPLAGPVLDNGTNVNLTRSPSVLGVPSDGNRRGNKTQAGSGIECVQ